MHHLADQTARGGEQNWKSRRGRIRTRPAPTVNTRTSSYDERVTEANAQQLSNNLKQDACDSESQCARCGAAQSTLQDCLARLEKSELERETLRQQLALCSKISNKQLAATPAEDTHNRIVIQEVPVEVIREIIVEKLVTKEVRVEVVVEVERSGAVAPAPLQGERLAALESSLADSGKSHHDFIKSPTEDVKSPTEDDPESDVDAGEEPTACCE